MKGHEQFCPVYNGQECDCNYVEPPVQAAAVPELPARILSLLREVADRNGTATSGPWEDGNGEPLQDDADKALAWIALAALSQGWVSGNALLTELRSIVHDASQPLGNRLQMIGSRIALFQDGEYEPPKSLLRRPLKAGERLVCYCPPGVCQAPKGFSGPCNRAPSTPKAADGEAK